MPRRLGRPGRGEVNVFVLAACILFIPWLVEGQHRQQPRRSVTQRRESPQESESLLHATKLPEKIDSPVALKHRKSTLSIEDIPIDESAYSALLAPANAVASPPARQFSTSAAGLSEQTAPRSLEDWEVEDFVLLATVDGGLWARDRKTGKDRWQVEGDSPMVATVHHRKNRSTIEDDLLPGTIDDYLWVIEPTRDGSLYMYRPDGPNRGLVPTGLTMKRLVEMAPYQVDNPPVVYTGSKKTTMYTIDARTGRVLKWFGSGGSGMNQEESCLRTPTGFVDADNDSCSNNATLTLGRTEYKVEIRGKDTHEIANLTYTEWGPNNYDQDLQRQHRETQDKRYIYSGHDGGVMGFDFNHSPSNPDPLFKHKFSSPVVRVFDVARPWGTEEQNPELIILPQPLPEPSQYELLPNPSDRDVFMNHTEDGSWYAMSAKSYPMMAAQKPDYARCYQEGSWQQDYWHNLDQLQLSRYLVGLHTIDTKREQFLTISGPSDTDNEKQSGSAIIEPPQQSFEQSILQTFQRLPKLAIDYLIEFIRNPMIVILAIGLLVAYQQQLRAMVGRMGGGKDKASMAKQSVISTNIQEAQVSQVVENATADVPSLDGVSEAEGSPKIIELQSTNVVGEKIDLQTIKVPETIMESQAAMEEMSPEKKKHKRGRRGGVRHKKGPRPPSQDPSLDGNPQVNGQASVEDAVRGAQKLGEQTKLEPDIQSVSNDPADVSGPILRIGSLEVNTEKMIGTGSNGTIVYEGNYDGRPVAIKRMLIQFFDIADQETKLLRESDDHPNGILSDISILEFH